MSSPAASPSSVPASPGCRSDSGSPHTRPPWSVTEQLPARLAGRTNLYPEIRYCGSAAFDPHTDGGFSELKVVRAEQIRVLPGRCRAPNTDALAEPLAVALHAVSRAGDLRGRDVLVNGAGPIGSPGRRGGQVSRRRHRHRGRHFGGIAGDRPGDGRRQDSQPVRRRDPSRRRSNWSSRHPARPLRSVPRCGPPPAAAPWSRSATCPDQRCPQCSVTWSPGRSPGSGPTGSSTRSPTLSPLSHEGSTSPVDHPHLRDR